MRTLPKGLTAALGLMLALAAGPASAATLFQETDLVSDGSVPAAHIDPDLNNPWGISHSPTSPFWISDNGRGLSTLYNGAGLKQNLVVTIPPPAGGSPPAAPTGNVFNNTGAFAVSNGTTSAPAAFLFATEDGTISGWSPTVNATNAVLAVDNSVSGAVYKGLAISGSGSSARLYAANFNSGGVELYDSSFHLLKTFTDTSLPAGYAPFNVQNLNGRLFVTFAVQNAAKHDDVAGAGNGFVDEFDLNGNFVRRVASGGVPTSPLNSPWGLDFAPGSFGAFANDLLVGNFGDGRIDAFDPDTGTFLGQLSDPAGAPMEITDLWALINGNGAAGGDSNLVYFSAGLADEAGGLFGSLGPVGLGVPEPATIALLLSGLASLAAIQRKRSG
ncbi:MAG: TIGR03118 family protein [Acetobacteraceae bacterium]|nr:TIGR03118 family protein [Acetobacteraceae bacterium]